MNTKLIASIVILAAVVALAAWLWGRGPTEAPTEGMTEEDRIIASLTAPKPKETSIARGLLDSLTAPDQAVAGERKGN